MRLIDADKLRIKCHTINDLQPDKFVVSRMMVSSEAIDTEPTVKAIPIEWLKKFANERALNDGMDGYWHFWGADLLQMIEQWEKENPVKISEGNYDSDEEYEEQMRCLDEN